MSEKPEVEVTPVASKPLSRILYRRTVTYGEDRDRVRLGRTFPGGPCYGPRAHLVESLAAVVGDDHADAIADALDAYLATDPADRVPTFQWSPSDHLGKAIKERDEAVARAEKAERALATKTRVKKRRKAAPQPKPE